MSNRLIHRIPIVLALVALAAAIYAATATASVRFEAEKYPPLELTGTTVGVQIVKLENGESLQCQSSKLSGTGAHAMYAATSSLGVAPTLSECEMEPYHWYKNVSFNMTGCEYRFKLGPEKEPGSFEGAMDIVGCNPSLLLGGWCSLGGGFVIPAQSGLPATFKVTGSGSKREIEIGVKTAKLKYNCGESTHTNGEYAGTWRLGGFDESGKQVGLSIKSSTEGEFSWDETLPSPLGKGTTLTEEANSSQVFEIESQSGIRSSFTCNQLYAEAGVQGTGATAIDSGAINYDDSSTAEKEACPALTNGIKLTSHVHMNECQYRYHAGTTVGPKKAEGTVDVVCPTGKAIALEAAGCNTTIPAQNGLGPVYYSTQATTPETLGIEFRIGEVAASKNNKAFTYSTKGITCGTHTQENGTYKGTATVKGFEASKNQTDVRVM